MPGPGAARLRTALLQGQYAAADDTAYQDTYDAKTDHNPADDVRLDLYSQKGCVASHVRLLCAARFGSSRWALSSEMLPLRPVHSYTKSGPDVLQRVS